MKYVYLTIGIILTFGLIYLTLTNIDDISKLDLSTGKIYTTYTGHLIFFSGIIGIGIASSIWGYFFQFNKLKNQKQVRSAEKASIKAEESQDKVKALEAKIETLEQALQKALK
ncbi:MAG: hypothetical protein AB7V50_09370 [Vampirovibrionia bacterium]